jgi:antitoxin component YwqK of YwqJK toxin-antitoxin module
LKTLFRMQNSKNDIRHFSFSASFLQGTRGYRKPRVLRPHTYHREERLSVKEKWARANNSKSYTSIMKTLVVKTVTLGVIMAFAGSVKSQTRIENKYNGSLLVQIIEYTPLGDKREQVTIKDVFGNQASVSTVYFTKNGKTDGPFKEYRSGGGSNLLQVFNYKEGKVHGEYVRYHYNGKIEDQGMYVNDRREGVWKSYFSDGTLWKTGEYINGEQAGEWAYYEENGTIWRKGSYVKGKEEGVWRTYFEDGSLESVKKFINGKEDTSFVTNEVVSKPCPNPRKLDNICMSLDSRTKDPKPRGDYYYMYQRKMLDAACVDVEKDSEEIVGRKIRAMWDKCWDKLKCHSIQFDASGGNILKFAVSTKFNEFIDDVIYWKVDLNKVDALDQRTVLDYITYQIEKNKGLSIESKYRHYYKILREAGAKHKSEL